MSGRTRFDFPWPEGAWLLAFLGAAGLSCITALWPGYAAEALSDLVKMVLVYFVMATSVVSERALRGMLWIIVLGALFPALGTLRNYLHGNLYEGRAAWVGIFSNPNEVAYSLVILMPFLAYLASAKSWLARLLLMAIALCYIGAVFVTFSRGGLIGLVAAAGVYAWRKRNIWLRIALVLALAGGLAFGDKHWSRGEDFSQLNNDVSFQQRIATSKVGIDMFMDHPVLGVGLKCSVIAWALYAPQNLYTRGALVTHNTFVQVFGETGLLGGIPFLLLIGAGLYHARKLALRSQVTNAGISVEVALWGFVVCGMSGGYVMTWFPYILLGITAAVTRIDREIAAEASAALNEAEVPQLQSPELSFKGL
jgi:O-antigen ligase